MTARRPSSPGRGRGAGLSRRAFLRAAAAAPLALPLGGAGGAVRSRVVEVLDPGVVGPVRKPDETRLRAMADAGILRLTGEKTLAAAWRRFVKPGDVVGVKVNSGGGRYISSKPAILEAVVAGLRAAGVPAERIVVWDQVEAFLLRGYVRRFRLEERLPGVRFAGCTPALQKENWQGGKPLEGFDTKPVTFPWGTVRIAKLVAETLTAIVNIPVLKDHSCAGVTLALKNITHAVVDVPWKCHDRCCNPYIPDIAAVPTVRKKLRLHVLDAVFGVADGGPSLKSLDCLFTRERLLVSTDPVAVDTLGLRWIEEARRTMGFPPLAEAENAVKSVKGRYPDYIAAAGRKGLGVNDPARIERVRRALPAEKKGEAEGRDGAP